MKAVAVWLPTYHLHLPFARWLTPILVGLGLSISMASLQAFRNAKTTIDPMHPEKVTVVVDSGIYGVTRNPMYVGMLMVLSGWAVHLQNVAAFVVLLLFTASMTQFQIRPEERVLEERFGEQYIDYRRRVPRWLFRLTEEDLQL
jgi:protein-S-isoprenylcysteine O-methyltransferase Ste14